jgi:hypothetical protein
MDASGLCSHGMTVKDCVVIRMLARIPRADGFALRMATFYAAFFLFGGIQMPYLPAWLQPRGLDVREIGIVLAAPMLMRIVAVPLATRLIDRHGEVQIALAIAATLRLGAGDLVWVLAATMAATAVATWRLPRSPDGAAVAPKQASGGLWRSGVFVAVIVGASLIQASHAVLYGFVTLQWTKEGLDGTAIGLLWAIGVVAEILLFAVSGRVVARVGAVEMILLGGFGAVLRWAAMAFDPPAILLPLLQGLHGLSFGATHLGAMDALSQLAHRRGATAQGDFSAVQGGTFAAAMGASGVLVAAFGSAAYFAMAALAAVGVAIALAARRMWRESYPT